jgi:UDP-N-acetylglucosamine 1-carboxyvinyltransferase
MGPLLARLGRAVVSLPGGCVIGNRPIDLHLRGFEALGAKVSIEAGDITISAPNGLVGAEIDLLGSNGPTVLGTDNIMMAATLARGKTVIEGAACEPEVVDLANFLNKMGAKIEGAGTRRITIEGVTSLHGVEHFVIPDRIEAGTFMVAAAMAGGGVTLHRVCESHLTAVTASLRTCGHLITFDAAGESCTILPGQPQCGGEITAAPFPGYPTDMQAQLTAMFVTTPGVSIIRDPIFPQRFMHCSELVRMGADIQVDHGTAVINGVASLSGAPVMASDLRASAALVLAGLTARGTTEISRVYHIDRGYEHIDEKLMMLGAAIERVQV